MIVTLRIDVIKQGRETGPAVVCGIFTIYLKFPVSEGRRKKKKPLSLKVSPWRKIKNPSEELKAVIRLVKCELSNGGEMRWWWWWWWGVNLEHEKLRRCRRRRRMTANQPRG